MAAGPELTGPELTELTALRLGGVCLKVPYLEVASVAAGPELTELTERTELTALALRYRTLS